MAAVTAPVEGFTGTVAGVEFKDGKGETSDDNALAYFRRHGYDVAEEETVDVPAVDFDPSDHTVDDVNDYLAAAEYDERERVLQAESDGKGRLGVLNGPHADLSGNPGADSGS